MPQLTTGHSEADLLNSRWCLPSISVVDVRVGTAEDGQDHYRFGPTRCEGWVGGCEEGLLVGAAEKGQKRGLLPWRGAHLRWPVP